MSSQQFQSAHESIHQLGTQVLVYLQEIRSGRLSEGDDTKGLQKVQEDIVKALNALTEQKYQVAVIAAMKAGKSTFLNALIGADILASESEACTVCRTDIRPIDNNLTPRLLEYQEGKREPIVIVQGKGEDIRRKFLDRTRQIRSTQNCNKVTRFELEHPIDAIAKLSSLAGFTLVDTPGPNEWESADFSTLELKKTALEALRTCNAILFILDYSSFKDNTNSELLQELIQERKEALLVSEGKLYFILNKVDRKAEGDRPIDDLIGDLRKELIGFGIPNPIIYSASAWQGLLAKLIREDKATETHKRDFKRFFSVKYARENEDGDSVIPAPIKIAPQALEDSGIPTIEESVIQTVVEKSGWNLLSDVLDKLDKAAKAIEDDLNIRINGWETELEKLKQNVENSQKHSDEAKQKVDQVKQSIKKQKEILIKGFSQVINEFATIAKDNISAEMNKLLEARKSQLSSNKIENNYNDILNTILNIGGILPNILGSLSNTFLEENSSKALGSGNAIFEIISNTFVGKIVLEVSRSLLDSLNIVDLTGDISEDLNNNKNYSQIKYKDWYKAQQLVDNINNFCTIQIQSWWLKTEDALITNGNKVREELTKQIKEEIQAISDELSGLIGEDLEIPLNINFIQFPNFEFSGIDNFIKTEQEHVTRNRKEKRGGGFCRSERYVDSPYETTENRYIIDLEQIKDTINNKIDSHVSESNKFLERAIEKQIDEDFKNAEQQIKDYIDRFQDIFNNIIHERETKERQKEEIISLLEAQKVKLNEYLKQLIVLRSDLNSWKSN